MTYKNCLTVARAEMQAARQLLQDEMRAYPTPVSGCDAQYNHMVGVRGAISEALRSLEELPFVATPRTLEPGAGVESR